MKMTVLSICDLLSVSFAADDRLFFLFLVRNNLRHVPWGSSTRWWHCQITLPRFKLIPLTPFSKYTHLLIWFQSLLSCIVSDLAFLDTVPNTHLIQLSISTNGITACERQIHFFIYANFMTLEDHKSSTGLARNMWFTVRRLILLHLWTNQTRWTLITSKIAQIQKQRVSWYNQRVFYVVIRLNKIMSMTFQQNLLPSSGACWIICKQFE